MKNDKKQQNLQALRFQLEAIKFDLVINKLNLEKGLNLGYERKRRELERDREALIMQEKQVVELIKNIEEGGMDGKNDKAVE